MTTIMRRDDPGITRSRPGRNTVEILRDKATEKIKVGSNAKTRMDEQTEPANQKARNSL